jgi:hypothetical protein
MEVNLAMVTVGHADLSKCLEVFPLFSVQLKIGGNRR